MINQSETSFYGGHLKYPLNTPICLLKEPNIWTSEVLGPVYMEVWDPR